MKNICIMLFLLTFSIPAFSTSIPDDTEPKPDVVGPGGGGGGGGGAGYTLNSTGPGGGCGGGGGGYK